MSNIRFVNRGKTGEIWLYDQVGEGFFGGMSAKQFNDELNKLGKVDTVNLRINSPGGSVFDGVAIYNALKRHPARVEVDVDGIAASIASVIAMAGDEIRMASNSMMMIHDPHGFSQGGAGDMRKTADLLDQIKNVISDTALGLPRHGRVLARRPRRPRCPGTTPDQRLIQNASLSTYGTEAVGADGGFAVPPEWRSEIMGMVDAEDSLLSRPISRWSAATRSPSRWTRRPHGRRPAASWPIGTARPRRDDAVEAGARRTSPSS
jgi:hypothetical protein